MTVCPMTRPRQTPSPGVWGAALGLVASLGRVTSFGALTLGTAGLAVAGCECSKSGSTGAPGRAVSAAGAEDAVLTAEQAARVLAKVGDRVITLGDYLAAVERLDRFERLRYQSPERRRLLLDEMINLELLAREAERRGLDQQPEVKAELRLLQRQEAERRLRASLPAPQDLPLSEVREYFDTHAADFQEPERRRAALLRVAERELAVRLLAEAKAADAEQWGDLVRKHSTLAPRPAEPISKNNARPPLEFEGDVGFVSASGDALGANAQVPAAVRTALFQIQGQGQVHPQVVSDEGQHYIVRLVAISAARQRTFSEAETTIRAQLLEARYQALEAELLKKLERTLPIEINEAALAELIKAPVLP
jgi:peptidyl-prolyl cis-trans isomerase C